MLSRDSKFHISIVASVVAVFFAGGLIMRSRLSELMSRDILKDLPIQNIPEKFSNIKMESASSARALKEGGSRLMDALEEVQGLRTATDTATATDTTTNEVVNSPSIE